MRRLTALIAVTIAISFISSCGSSTSSGKVLVDINGNKITEGDLEFLGEINPRIKAQISNPAGKKRILDNLVDQEILYQEAVKEGINRDPKVKAKVDLYRRVIIAQSLVEDQIEKSAKKYYEEHPADFSKIKLSQIMIKFASPEEIKKAKKSKAKKKKKLHTEKQALEIITQLKEKIDKGEDFAKAARENSGDIATKSRGGDLGLTSKDDKRLINRGLAPLLDKAFTMKVGEVSGPIKTAKGYHLIKLTRGVEPESFEEAKQGIIFKVRGDAKNDLLARLKKDATIVYPEQEKKKAAKKDKKEKGKGKGKEKGAGKHDHKKGEKPEHHGQKMKKEKIEEKINIKEMIKGDKVKIKEKIKIKEEAKKTK
ncbi:MAG: hypothetical protein HN337_00700 [Deltaproteobacteria bacterium]|jgi:peptidyl-prolyl cis-trans isomerase C|nr:hypothetical protein [Deltaproteobacteria bacterium]